jgi:hypothetical protein
VRAGSAGADPKSSADGAARPVVQTQLLDELRLYGGRTSLALSGKDLREQIRDVLASLAERRQAHDDAVETRKEIGPSVLGNSQAKARNASVDSSAVAPEEVMVGFGSLRGMTVPAKRGFSCSISVGVSGVGMDPSSRGLGR